MASLKDVRMKIAGVGKTKQITKAMNMVASAKLRGAQTRMEKFRSYADRFHAMLQNIVASEQELTHALLVPHEEVRNVAILLATSDRGLCGAFNANIISKAFAIARAKEAEGKKVTFHCIGRKGRDAVRKSGFSLAASLPGYMTDINFHTADRIGHEVITGYIAHTYDEVILVYSEFVSMMRQVPTVEHLLPLTPQEQAEEKKTPGNTTEYIFEPAGNALMNTLLPRVVKSLVYRGLLETSTSENAARMTAMDNATRNCDELLRTLTRLFNKTRQAAITSELIDIVGGVEALKG